MVEKNEKTPMASGAGSHLHSHGRDHSPEGEAQLERLGYEFSYLQQQANQLQQQLAQLQAIAKENEAAIAALGALKQMGETLMPIGSGVFFKVSISDTEKVFAEIGSQLIAEKSAADALKLLLEKKGNLERALRELEGNFSAVGQRMNELQQKAAEIEESEHKH